MTPRYTPEHLKRWTMPSSYFGATWENYYGAGFGHSRDSSELEESNFAVLQRELAKLPPFESPDDEAESRNVVRESHWAVGWVEWIAIHESDTAALKLCDDLRASANDYPVLDDDDFSNREDESARQIWKDCYRPKERLEYIRKNRSQFYFNRFADLMGCVRGKYFAGYASELLS